MAGQTPFNAQNAIISTSGGTLSSLGLTAGATVVKAVPGKIMRILVNTAATTAVSVNDCATAAAVAAGNLVYTSASSGLVAGTMVTLEFPCLIGIVVTVGTGGVVSVSYV
jgi:hypothetical protein